MTSTHGSHAARKPSPGPSGRPAGVERVAQAAADATERMGERVGETVAAAKPKLRGWLHTGMAPLVFLGGLVLVVLGPTLASRIGDAIYMVCALMLFGTSATYHRGRWTPRLEGVFRRWDHANIFLFIAGTYTALAFTLLHGRSRAWLLGLVWGAAALGVAFRILWLSAPRALYTVLYVVMGWAAVFWMLPLWRAGGAAVVSLVVAGGLVYTGGAVVYGLKRPNPSPIWFGFHEIFHACTVVAALCHYLAIVLATFR